MSQETENQDGLKELAIEGKLPLKAVGIENLKEDNPKHMPPHRYLLPWFARRPTPASRLAILASVLPKGISNDEILELLQIGPPQGVEGSLEKYVEEKKATEDTRSGTLGEHYGYPRPYTSTPNEKQREKLHKRLRDQWNGDLPTVLDPTAGGGVIPFESLRYGLPTEANELNPVPSVLLKSMLDYPISVGHLRRDFERWAKKIDEVAGENISKFYPDKSGRTPSHYACSYTINCPSCGCEIPLVPSWWLLKRSASKGIAVMPKVTDGTVSYRRVEIPDDISKDEFNPQNGPRSRGGNVECLNCDIVTESDEIKQKLRDGEFEYEILGVKYNKRSGGSGYRAPTKEDYDALEDAAEYVSSDVELFTLLDHDIPKSGQLTATPVSHGITKWRDLFSPRQLIALHEYQQAFSAIKEDIRGEYEDEKRIEAILTVLSFATAKMVDRNSRISPYSISRGYPENALGGKNYSFQWLFVDNNPASGDQCYMDAIQRVIDSYEDLTTQVEEVNVDPVEVVNGNAANLPYDDNSIQSVVIDPPYYSNVMYSELSDILYVWLRQYLNDAHPSLFATELTEKDEEAVANPAKFDDIAGSGQSKRELAKGDYEGKMSDIFCELHRVLDCNGILTVMFTHRETDAWDTLTTSLINAGFTVTATHPITSEMPYRIDVRGGRSTESTLLLTSRKRENEPRTGEVPTLWADVKIDTRDAAKEAARDLLDSGISLTKTDVIISAFGPTLRVFSEAYPVVNDKDEEVPPRKALEEARDAVTQVLVDEYLEAEGVDDLDDVTEWYILSWLVHEKQTFSYDEGHQLGLGLGVDIDDIKRSTKTWRKSRGDISLRSHSGRVQNINEKPENRSSRTPVNPDDLSFGLALDKVHAAMHVYDVQGESACCDWLRNRNFDSDSTFKSTLKALLQVLPHDHEDWELARDLAVGRTRDLLNLDFSPNVFAEDNEQTQQTGFDDY
jgi:adenine-specific DNA methylase